MLIPILTVVLGLGALVLLIPCATLGLEVLAAFSARSKDFMPQGGAIGDREAIGPVAVLIPAHNESVGIERTLAGLQPQLRPQDRLVVIADNCSDDTAQVATAAGAEVVERFNTSLRGKGYALDFGLNYLKSAPPSVVILMDADCDTPPGSLAQLAHHALTQGRPVQANYLIEQPPSQSLKGLISAFAIKVKNLVRPLGLRRLGAPCLLTGTGIALPWEVAIAVNVASGHIAEDMKWGLDLALAGHPPTFLASAKVTSRLPSDDQAAKTQRTRWEHGHLQIMKEYLPKLFSQGLRRGRLDLMALGLELSILPLSLLVMVWAAGTALTLVFALITQAWLPLAVASLAGLLLFSAVFLAWARFGRDDISLRQLVMIPLYILWKIPLYIAFLIRPEKQWIRTQRDK
ncbi:glycosyl transferase [Leptolyngbya sp. BL0902]|uniref:glycosyltransferase family 2 protein n=1 Tax=Leptolyngbya sp. BL0902 TaxID=1115757 RepID=UPI0018E885CE|nr:glycosyltransferase family 2 protein [Leptolyngbya sp. BL0902]QQE65789.1 glycosyl transferase [Leptolyngbya sp. BL0902]